MPGTNSSQTPLAPIERIGIRRPSQRSKSPTIRTLRAFGAQTAKLTPVAPSCVRTCAPSTSYRCSWVPSPIRCRSTSPSVGPNRYGSSSSQALPSGKPNRTRYVNCPGRSSATKPAHRPSPIGSIGSTPPFGATSQAAFASGWKARTTVPSSAGCAPRIACGSWCSPRARRPTSSLEGAAWIVVIVLTIPVRSGDFRAPPARPALRTGSLPSRGRGCGRAGAGCASAHPESMPRCLSR